MAHATPYCYKALSEEAYNALAAHIVTSTLDASFFPNRLTIVVTPKEDEEEGIKEVEKFIDDEQLDVNINPIILDDTNENNLINDEATPSYMIVEILVRKLSEHLDVEKNLQTRLTACEADLSKARNDVNLYNKWRQEESTRRNRLEETIIALRTLLNIVVE